MIALLGIKRLTQRQKFIAEHLHLPMKQARKTVKTRYFGGEIQASMNIPQQQLDKNKYVIREGSNTSCNNNKQPGPVLRSCPSRTNILRAKNISSKHESAKTNRNSNTYDKFNTEVSNSIDGKPCRPMTSTHFAGQSRSSIQLKTVKRLLIIQLAACSTLYKQVRSEISWTTKSNTERH